MSKIKTITVSEELYGKLSDVKSETGASITYLAQKAIAEFLEKRNESNK